MFFESGVIARVGVGRLYGSASCNYPV